MICKHSLTLTDMRKKIFTGVLALLILVLPPFMQGCRDSEPWDEVPSQIAKFITQYFPNEGLASITESSDTYHVRLDSGPGLTFDKNCEWEAINGYGMPLPKVLLFDQLPPALYSYIEESGNSGSVFSIERDSEAYTVVLLASTLSYDVETGRITGSDRQPA